MAGVPADQMIFLQQVGTMVQSAMQPFALHTRSVEMAHLGARVDMMQTELQAEIARRTSVQHKSPSSEGLSNISASGFGARPPVTQQAFGAGGSAGTPVPPPGISVNQVGGPQFPPVPPLPGHQSTTKTTACAELAVIQ